MPPESPVSNENQDRLLSPGQQPSYGPVVGIVIIVLIMTIGALYFWSSRLNQPSNAASQVPFVPADSTTTLP